MYILLAWIVIALVAGFIADYLVGRARQYERWELFVVGMVGSFVGGAIFSFLEGGDLLALRPSGLIGSIIGAIVVLLIYGPVRDRLRANAKPATPAGKNTAMKSKKK
jgi:uncharacterized membrane protein YeaQ/YmgE (transglycosylase-associated protein family)